ncbi:MAG TPA: hypothetical protein VHA52_09660 [Candidatus Babeliaceae bacterium]|nr:hypothetical protein [Candidatus Babeliaceae bacterium]
MKIVQIISMVLLLGIFLSATAQEELSKTQTQPSTQSLYSWLSSGLSSGAAKAKSRISSGVSYLNPQSLLPWAQSQWQSLTHEAQEWWQMPKVKAQHAINRAITYSKNLYGQAISLTQGLPGYLRYLQSYISENWDALPTWQKAQIGTLLIALAISLALAYGGGSYEVIAKLFEKLDIARRLGTGSPSGSISWFLGKNIGFMQMDPSGQFEQISQLKIVLTKEQAEGFVKSLIGNIAVFPTLTKLISILFERADQLVGMNASAGQLEEIQKDAEVTIALAQDQIGLATKALDGIKKLIPS